MDSVFSWVNAGMELQPAIEPWGDDVHFGGIKLINVSDFSELILRLLLNVVLVFVISHFIYLKHSKRKDFYFSYLAIGVMVFLLCFLLNNVKLELGFALGLFAIFGIIRYRTDAIPIKEMTYLFIIIGVSVINALANKKVSYMELMLTNLVVVGGLWWLESRLWAKQEKSMLLIYEKIENIHQDKEGALLDDLRQRMGINIIRYEINRIDFLRDTAELTIYYRVGVGVGCAKSEEDGKQ